MNSERLYAGGQRVDDETPYYQFDPIVEEEEGWVPPPIPEIGEFPYEGIVDFKRDREYVVNQVESLKYEAILRRVKLRWGQISEQEAEAQAYDYWLRWKIETDLFFFGDQVLGWCDARDRHGTRWRVYPPLHRWLCRVLQLPGDKLILLSRLHLKTTWVKLNISRRIIIDPNSRSGLFSITADLVEHELKDVARILSSPILLRLYPQQIPDPGPKFKNWERVTANELTVKRDHTSGKVPQEPQLFAAGVGTHVVGFHFDFGDFDDILDQRVVESPARSRVLEDWWQYMTPILEVDAETTVTGTPYHYADQYARMIREGQFGRQVFVRGCWDKEHKPIYRSWFTVADLKKWQKRLGPVKFAAQMECNPEPSELKPFPAPQPQYSSLPADEKGYKHYCLIDPAATIETYSNHTAFVIVSLNSIRQAWVQRAFQVKRKGEELADILITMHLLFNFTKVGVELGLQTHLQTVFELKERLWEQKHKRSLLLSGRIQGVPIKKVHKVDRITDALGPLIRENRIKIHESCTELLDQMDKYTGAPKDEDDLIDALSMLTMVVEHLAPHRHLPRELRTPGMTVSEFRRFALGKRRGWDAQFQN